MSKRNVAFVRPEEPNFLKRIKDEIGYKEPDTIEAKRAALENLSDDEEDFQEKEDERPQVVQVREGDLTEEEAAKLAKEEAEKPADLSQRIVFKVKRKEKAEGCAEKDSGGNSSTKPMTKTDSKEKSRRKNQKPAKSSLLSFAEDEDEG